MKTMTAVARVALAAVVMMMAAAPAAAVIKVATYTGEVVSGHDNTGEFGPAGTDLTGLSFVTRFVYDTGRGYRDMSPRSYDHISGSGSTNPILSATVTIGGVSRTLKGPNYYGYARVDSGDAVSQQDADNTAADGSFNDNIVTAYENTVDIRIPTSLETSYTDMGEVPAYEYVKLSSYNYDAQRQVHDAVAIDQLASLTISDYVPEPATWTLMIGGFGAIGAATRRRAVVAA